MAKKKKKKQGFLRRAWHTKKGKYIIIASLVVLVPTIALGAASVYTPWATQTAQKAVGRQAVKDMKEKAKHPIKTAIQQGAYDITHIGPRSKKVEDAENKKERQASKSGRSAFDPVKGKSQSAYFKDIMANDSATGDALKRLKAKNPSKYNEIMNGIKARGGMKNGKMSAAAQKYLDDELAKVDPTFKKQMQQNAKNTSKDGKDAANSNDEDSSFKSKIASALLHIFWSTGLGKWLEQNGAAGTIFTYNPLTDGNYGHLDQADVVSQLQDKVDNHPSQLMFPASAYSTKFTAVIDAISPGMYGLAAVMLVAAVIIGATKMGAGQMFNGPQSRVNWYHNMIDVIISVCGIFCLPIFIRMMLQLDGAFLISFASLLQNTPNGTGNGHSMMLTALQLGFDDNTIKAVTKGDWLGSGFAGVIFTIIYIWAIIGLSFWIKYYYFARMIAFIILMVLGPIFIAMWPFDIGKARTLNWLRDVVGTIFIQPIHAFTITMMAFLISINSANFGGLAQSTDDKKKAIATMSGQTTSDNAISNALTQLTSAGQDFTVANHFEMMVMAIIVLILFQPVSKGIASLFGIGTNMLDNIHSSTSRTLLTGTAIAGTAALGLAGGALAGASSAAHGASFAKAAIQQKLGEKALDKAEKKGSLGKQSLLRRKTALSNLGKQKDDQKQKALRDLAKANGIVGPNAGRLIGAAAGAGTGNVANVVALTAAGGAIGEKAAKLNQMGVGLGALGLKRANLRRAHDNHVKAINAATNRTLAQEEQSKVDANPGPEGSITDQVKNNSRLSDQDRAAALRNAQAYETSGVNGQKPTPSSEALNQRLQMEKNKDINGKYIPNSKVQSNIQSVMDSIPDGQKYDQVNGVPQNEAALQTKAQAMGFDLAKWRDLHRADFKDAPKAEQQQLMAAAANDAMNNMRGDLSQASQIAAGNAGAATRDIRTPMSINEIQKAKQVGKGQYEDAMRIAHPNDFKAFKNTREYQKGLVRAQSQALDKAYANSNGGVIGHEDMSQDPAFNASVIDANRYKDSLGDQMDRLAFSPELNKRILGSTEGINGKSMVQKLDAGRGDTAQTIDTSLLSKMRAQRAYTMRNEGFKINGRPINENDLNKIYPQTPFKDDTGNTLRTPQEIADYLQKENLNNYGQVNASQNEWNQLSNITEQALRSGSAGKLTSMASGLFGMGTPTSSSRMGRLASPNAQPNSGLLGKLTSSNPYVHPTNTWSMDQVRQNVPIQNDDEGKPVGVNPGSIRSVITNNYSMLQARDKDGVYHTVGNLGPGDGSLGANDKAYQDYDLTPNGTLTPMIDSSTHRPTTPYRLDNGNPVPITLPNGAPDLGTYFDHSDSGNVFNSPASRPYAYSSYRGIPYAKAASQAIAEGKPIYGNSFANYKNKQIQGNYDGVVITGEDPLTHEQQVLSEEFDNTIWPGMDTGYQFTLPIKESAGDYVFDTSRSPQLIPDSGALQDPARQESLRDEMNSLFNAKKKNICNYVNSTMLPITKPNIRNFMANNYPGQNFDALDTFSKQPEP